MTNRRLTQATMAVGALVLTTLATAAPSSRTEFPTLIIRTVVVRGSEVTITVVNRALLPQSGTVTSQVLTPTGIIDVTAPVTAAAGQTTTIKVNLTEPVSDESPLGVVVDDGVPF